MARSGKKLDLVQELTTHKSDYKAWPLPRNDPPPRPTSEDISRPKPTREIPQIDYQSHLPYSNRVPFDLYLQPKPILRTNPRDPIPPSAKSRPPPKDHFRFRLPGKSVTDVTDEDIIRNLLLNTYVPVHNGIYLDACLKPSNPPPEPEGVFVNDRVKFTPEIYPPLPEGWLEAAKHWDCLQSRILGDPTKTFWTRRGPEVECFSKLDCNDIIPKETKREIRSLIEEDRLRLPFTITKTGYRGYRQISAKGVPLRRNDDFDF